MYPDVGDNKEEFLSRTKRCQRVYNLTGCITGNSNVVTLYKSTDVEFAMEKRVKVINESDVESHGVELEDVDLLLTCDM